MSAADSNGNPMEALASEFVERHRRGERPTAEEYAAKYPQLAKTIRELFPTIAALEKVRDNQEQLSGGRAATGPNKLKQLGDFRIVREIGRGGMGIVYEAVQESLCRRVAVKVLARSSQLDDTHRRRFLREARTAGQLHHTNIVPILGVGQENDLDFYVMQYIDGTGLDGLIGRLRNADADRRESLRLSTFWRRNDSDLSISAPTRLFKDTGALDGDTAEHPRDGAVFADSMPAFDSEVGATQPVRQLCHTFWQDVALVGLQVAQALDYAHSQGTLHRDIKPANLLIDGHGITWVADFGLAEGVEQDALSRTGEILGTLLYMAPEQWRGVTDVRSDIYSLGVTLYELLTLRLPCDVPDRIKALSGSGAQPTVSAPRKIRPSIPVDLETIVMTAMADDPGRRYQTAAALADDLSRFLEDQPISVRRPTLLERWSRWRRRNPAVAALSAVAAVSLVVAAVVPWIDLAEKSAALRREKEEKQRADSALIREKGAHEEANAALGREKDAHAVATTALDREKTERARAEAILATTLATLDQVFDHLVPDRLGETHSKSLSGEEGGTAAGGTQAVISPDTAVLLEELRAVYDKLGAEEGGKDKLGKESARASRRVGDIHARLGNTSQADAAYRQAIKKYESLRGSDPQILLEIARLHNDLGAVHSRDPEPSRSQAEHQIALALLQGPHPSTRADERFELARTYYMLGRGPDPRSNPTPGAEGEDPRRGPRGGPPPGEGAGPPGDDDGPPPRRDERKGPPFRFGERGGPNEGGPGRRPRPGNGPFRMADDDDGGPPGPALGGDGPPTRTGHGNGPPKRTGHGNGPPERTGHGNGPPERTGPMRRRPGFRPTFPPPGERDFIGDGPDGDRLPRRAPPPDKTHPEDLKRAIAILEPLIKEEPQNPEYRYLLAQCYREGTHTGPLPEIEKSVKLLAELVKEYPRAADYRFELADTYAMLDVRELSHDQNPQAEKRLRAALEQSTALVDGHPYAADYTALHVHILHKLAHLLRDVPPELADRPAGVDEAAQMYQEAVRRQEGLVKRFPQNSAHRFWLARIRMSLAQLWFERREPSEARKVLETAIHETEPYQRAHPEMPALGQVMHDLYDSLSEALDRLDLSKQADEAQQKAAAFKSAHPSRPREPRDRPKE